MYFVFQEYKELGRPKKPMSSYFLFAQTKKDMFQSKQLKDFQNRVTAEWNKLPENEKAKFDKQAAELMNKYRSVCWS